MQNRCKRRIVVGWNLAKASRLLGRRVLLRVGTADEPEDRWYLPRNAEHSEILACGRGLGFADLVAAEMISKRVDDAPRRVWVNRDQRVAIERRDLRWLRSTRRRRLSVDDSRDRREYARPHILVESPDVQFYDSFVWNDVLLVSCLQ